MVDVRHRVYDDIAEQEHLALPPRGRVGELLCSETGSYFTIASQSGWTPLMSFR